MYLNFFLLHVHVDYVSDLYGALLSTPRHELKAVSVELKETTPEPLFSMLECQSKDEAIAKYKARKQKEITIVPPTCPGKTFRLHVLSYHSNTTIFIIISSSIGITMIQCMCDQLRETFSLT